jgi:transcriptional regulator with XRE-family HTH domain
VRSKDVDQLFYRHFGQLLSEARRKQGISQEILADELGFSRTSITNIEKGRQPIQLHNLYLIARLLSVEIKELLPSPQLFDVPQNTERLSVSRSEWLNSMDVNISGEKPHAKKKRHRERSSKAPRG